MGDLCQRWSFRDGAVMPRGVEHTLRIGSLFSGIGGLDLGVEIATGGRTLWQVERDPWCRRVLARHWPGAVRFDNVCTAGDEAHPLAPVDLVCGGFPCQPVSLAGQRKGVNDERWLWPQFARVLRVVRPRFVLLENVRGVLTANGGRALAEVLGSLAELGFAAEWDLFRASDVGAPHRRERWFCLAYRSGDGVGVGHADPHGGGEPQPQGRFADERGRSGNGGQGSVVDTAGARREGLAGCCRESSRQLSEVARGGSGVALADPERIAAQRHGGPGDVARASGDAQGEAREQRRGDAVGGGGEDRSGVDLVDPEGEGLSGDGVCGGGSTALSQQRLSRGRDAQSGVGRIADGLPCGLDGARWPAGRGEAQHAWEPPRTSTGSKDRRHRLKALGNAVVPAQAALALRVLAERAGVTGLCGAEEAGAGLGATGLRDLARQLMGEAKGDEVS